MKFLRRYEVWLFLFLLLVANAIFVTSVVEGILPEQVYGLGRFALLGFLLFTLILLVRGLPGLLEVLTPMVKWGRSYWFYVFAILWTTLLCLLVLLGKGLITGESLTLEQLRSGMEKLANPKLIVTLLVSSFFGEIVWVSYAIRKLAETFTDYVSALIVGLVWTLWWLPMAIHNYGIIPELPLVALLFNQMGIALMCAFVYYHARSGLVVLLMQIVFNSTILVFPVTPTEGGPSTYWAFALTYFSTATILFLRFGPHPLLVRRTRERVPTAHGAETLPR